MTYIYIIARSFVFLFIFLLKDIYEFYLFAMVPRHISFVFVSLFALLAGEKLDWPIAVFDSHVGV